jgi:SAM-dependent methyltransferase
VEPLERAMGMRWYHALELAPGRVTEGLFDLRPYVDRYGLPERMDGLRALEVGTWDGFWAFEMERRGASLVASRPRRRARPGLAAAAPAGAIRGRARGARFALAREILGSQVDRRCLSVYAARPDELGSFDVVLCGSVLIHLRDQLLALERMAALTKPGGATSACGAGPGSACARGLVGAPRGLPRAPMSSSLPPPAVSRAPTWPRAVCPA